MVTVPLLPLDQIIDLYPALSQVQPTLAEIGAALQPYQVPTDTVLFAENTACQGFPLVIEGECRLGALPPSPAIFC